MIEKRNAQQAEARKKTPIDPAWLCASLNAVMPDDTIYIDEVTTHTALLRQHLVWNKPQCLFTRQGGLGQGLGLSLGIKLAKPQRPVVTLIGDGAFLYNPALGSLGAARDYNLPIMAVIFNNKKIRRDAGHAPQDVSGRDRRGDRRLPRHAHQRAGLREGRRIRWRLRRAGNGSGKTPGRAEARPRSQPQRQASDHRRDRYIDVDEAAMQALVGLNRGGVIAVLPFSKSFRN
jgi:hypothetical protein